MTNREKKIMDGLQLCDLYTVDVLRRIAKEVEA